LDVDQATEEVVEVTAAVSNQLTVARGADSTTAWPHAFGGTVMHGISARDADEANLHVNSTSGIHGVTGALVGTTDAQTLTNKTLTSATLNTSTINTSTIRDTSIIRGNPSNGLNPLSIRVAATDVEVGYVDRNGVLQAPRLRAINTDAAQIPLTVQGATSQSAALVSMRDSASIALWVMTSVGRVGVGAEASASAHMLVKNKTVTDATLRVQESIGQTSDMLSIVDSSGNHIWGVDHDGPRPTSWLTISLPAGQIAHNRTPEYRRYGRKVELRGTQKRSDGNPYTAGSGATLFTLPAGYRPTNLEHWAGQASLTGSGTAGTVRMQCDSAGVVTLWTQDDPDWVAINGYFWVD
jgi:hypothetical protein